jgi:hypothetical protein
MVMHVKTLNLNLVDRVSLMSILPNEGDIIMLRIIRDARLMLAFTSKELSDFQVRQEPNRVFWNEQGDACVRTFKFDDNLESIIVQRLKELSNHKQLGMQCVNVYELFVEGKPQKKTSATDE